MLHSTLIVKTSPNISKYQIKIPNRGGKGGSPFGVGIRITIFSATIQDKTVIVSPKRLFPGCISSGTIAHVAPKNAPKTQPESKTSKRLLGCRVDSFSPQATYFATTTYTGCNFSINRSRLLLSVPAGSAE